MKLTHKQKVKMAKKMLSSEEVRNGTPKFQSAAWEDRKNGIAKKLANK